MRWVELFQEDIAANNASPLRKKWWLFLFMRLENACPVRVGKRVLALVKKILLMGTGCEFAAESFWRGGVRIPHLNGIVINPAVRIGSDVTVFHQVALGISGDPGRLGAPAVGDGATLGAGCKVLGPVEVVRRAYVGANAVVTKDVPADATVVGANRVVRTRGRD